VGRHAVCNGEFTLALPLERALQLFTPEGERAWAGDDWDPQYPVPPPAADGAAVGTVFTTPSTGGDAVWIVVARSDDSVAYARVVPGHIAGTIRVACSAADGGCHVRVTYDVTSLAPAGDDWIREFERGYSDFLEHWRRAIVASLSSA
jgi:hypothetical protein